MSMRIVAVGGQCPCIPCQKAHARPEATRALIKRAKLHGNTRELKRLTK